MKFVDILEEVNGFGRFQLRMIFLMVIPRLTLPFHFLLNNFIVAVPSHHCDISSLDDGGVFGNLSQAERLIVSIPVQEDGTPDSCQMFVKPQFHLLLNSSNITDLPTVSCQNGWTYDNTTFKSTLATEWDLVCDKKRLNRATATIFFTGVMFGAAVFGYLSDRFGRKSTILVSYILTTIFGFASAFSYHLATFAVMRFLTGFGISGVNIIAMVLCLEWVDVKHRTAVGILLTLDWTVCATLLPAVAYFVNDWRWVPESARWLINDGQMDRAHFYLHKCAKVNHREQFMADLNPELLPKEIQLENENRKYSYLDLVKTPRMRTLTLLTGILWFGVSCTYYGISLNVADFGANIYLTQFIYGAIEIPAKTFIFFTLNKVGRRLNEAGTVILTGLCIFCNMFIPQDMMLVRTAVGSLGKMFSEASFVIVVLYTSELYPTVMRQSGLGYCSFMALIGVSVSPLIMVLEEVWLPLPSLAFSLLAFAAGLSACSLSETQNACLPETIEDVEQTRMMSMDI
uniref:solute carrier family 22 member 7-like isoform X2 n=1 Tax=Scatophagus argus TaxID=75038 RepID=UPI001ED80F91|nr:solute carrier family 22 member 7-like isoform X2 [Scatophagus argus]